MADCIFCKIIAKQIPADIIYEDEKLCAFRDINPQAPHHFLVIPAKHIETLNDVDASDGDLLAYMMLIGAQLAKQEGIAETGYRFVMNCLEEAGQTVWHIHLHVLGGRPLGWPPG